MKSPFAANPWFWRQVRVACLGLGALAAAAIVVGVATRASADEPPAEMTPTVLGPVWTWSGTQMSDGAVITPDDGAQYTIELLPDGRVAVQADCNWGIGSYTLDGKHITIGPLGFTRAACPLGSLGDTFLAQLSAAAIHFVQDGDLYLDLQFDSGTMRFSPGA